MMQEKRDLSGSTTSLNSIGKLVLLVNCFKRIFGFHMTIYSVTKWVPVIGGCHVLIIN
jgi:hypothetical protein